MWTCSFLFLFAAAFADGGSPASAMVDSLLQKHSPALVQAVELVQSMVGMDTISVQVGKFLPKSIGSNVPARELTLVDSSIGMVDAVAAALGLGFPARRSKLDVVLANTVSQIASAGVDIVQLRASRRAMLRRASRCVSELNGELQRLVPDFGKPIAGHVNFALVEVLVRALGWRHSSLMRDLLFGFEPIGCIRDTGCLRPVSEPVPPLFSRESNANSFDEAVSHLSKKARRADSEAVQDQWVVWDKSLSECEKGFCVGPLSRRQVEALFADSEFGPRCIPAFGVWQKGSLRRIDDACRSEHNLLTQMRETIVCVSADLPADIAVEFYKYLPSS